MKEFSAREYIEESCAKLETIRDTVLVAVSGGVDSSVSAALLHKAGVPLTLIHIDSGFERKDEPKNVVGLLSKAGLKVELIDAQEAFYRAIKGVADPVIKREKFRQTYFSLIIEYCKRKKVTYLAQGSQLRSGSYRPGNNTPTETFEKTKINLIEPVMGLSKSQIRALAKELGLPDEIVKRKPFPGPGLLIRFGGLFSEDRLAKIREATFIVDSFVEKHENDFKDCFQIFPYLGDNSPVLYLPKKNKIFDETVYIPKIDEASLGDVLLLRSIGLPVEEGGYTKQVPFFMKPELQAALVNQLMRIDGIGRVCLDITPKYWPPLDDQPSASTEYI